MLDEEQPEPVSLDFDMDGSVLILRVFTPETSIFQSSFVIFLHNALCDVEVAYPVVLRIILTTFPRTESNLGTAVLHLELLSRIRGSRCAR